MTHQSTYLSTNLYEQEFSRIKTIFNKPHALFEKIVSIMAKNRVCGDKNILKQKPNIKAIDTILKSTTNSFTAMKALECMFDDITFQSQFTRDIGSHVNIEKQFLTKGRWLNMGTYGFTFIAKLDSIINFVCKLSKETDIKTYRDTVIEYFIGAAVINNFRKFCPNFCYTLGTFKCNYDEKSKEVCSPTGTLKFFTFYEYIKGIQLNKIKTPEEFLIMVVQLLLALELAQRENRFFHNDISVNNVMITEDTREFNIILDNRTFSFNSKVAMIIDYGLSCATVNGMRITSVGPIGMPDDAFVNVYNRVPFLLQGIDMIMLIVSAIESCNNDVSKFASDMMKQFFGTVDPYQIFTMTMNQIREQHGVDYFGKYATSRIASITPHQFLDMILEDPKLSGMLSKYLKISDTMIMNHKASVYTHYKDIYGKDFVADMSCIGSIDSYMLGFEVLQNALVSDITSPEIENLRNKMRSEKGQMIKTDINMLEYIFKIKISSDFIEKTVMPMVTSILSMRYKDPKAQNEEINYDLIQRFRVFVDFMTELETYSSLFFKIQYLNMPEKEYMDIYRRFIESEQYYVYIKYGKWIRAGTRWSDTLFTGL